MPIQEVAHEYIEPTVGSRRDWFRCSCGASGQVSTDPLGDWQRHVDEVEEIRYLSKDIDKLVARKYKNLAVTYGNVRTMTVHAKRN